MLSANLFEKYGRTFQPNEIVFCEFEPGDSFYFVQEGAAKVTKIIADKEKTLDYFGEGDIFGEMAIMDNAPRSATIIAVEPLKVLEFNKDNFVSLLQAQPALAYKILKLFCKRIFDAKRQLSILVLDKPEVKVADVFLWLISQLGMDTDDVTSDITLTRTVDDIAGLSGTSLSECQAIIKEFVSSGILAVTAKSIVVKKYHELERLVTQKKKIIDRRNEG